LVDCYFTLKAWNAQNGGAAAILVADDKAETLITMDTPEEGKGTDDDYVENISIPSVLISKSLGDSIKKALSDGEMVNMNLDWTEALPHPDDRVEYELWTNSNDECGQKCDSLINFLKDFKGVAQLLEQKGFTQFTPRYITWFCPEAFLLSKQCKSQCINNGRYCAPDPEQDFSSGYDGKNVVVQNLRQACFYKVANESGKPWQWWDYVTDFSIRCPMKEKKYTEECSDQVIKSLGMLGSSCFSAYSTQLSFFSVWCLILNVLPKFAQDEKSYDAFNFKQYFLLILWFQFCSVNNLVFRGIALLCMEAFVRRHIITNERCHFSEKIV